MAAQSLADLVAIAQRRARAPLAGEAGPVSLSAVFNGLQQLPAPPAGDAGEPPRPAKPAAEEEEKPKPTGLPERASVTERLTRRFGLGEAPAKRRHLYQRLERLAEQHGEAVLALISEAVAQAVAARSPGRYFCMAVCAKLREKGFFYSAPEGGELW